MIRRSFNRSDRVADVIHRALAGLVRDKFKEDPRVGMVTISAVKVSPDLKYAKVFVTILEDAKTTESLLLLNQAAGFFRSHLARSLNLRVAPTVAFTLDESEVRARRIYTLLGQTVDSL
jgi:ribosome-binding factor A